MNESEFKAKMVHAQIMRNNDNRPDYWAGFIRGLRRAYHGERFGTEAEHTLWSSMADSDDTLSQQRGLGYRDGLDAG